MFTNSTAPRHGEVPARDGRRWWPIPVAVVALLALVAGIIFLPRLWPKGGGGSAAGSESAAQECAEPGTWIAVSNDYSNALATVADAYNKDKGACTIGIAPYQDTKTLAELLTDEKKAPKAVIGTEPTTTLSETFDAELSDGGAVAAPAGVVAVPESLVSPLGWKGSPTWSEVTRTLTNAQRWTGHGHAELGSFDVALADVGASSVTRGFALGLAASSLSKSPASVTANDIGNQKAQAALLGLVRQATVVAADQPGLTQKIKQADSSGKLPATVSAALLDEQNVITYNSTNPSEKLRAFYPKESSVTAPLNIRLTPEAGEAKRFAQYLTGDDGQQAIKDAGLRAADGSATEKLTENKDLNAVGGPAETQFTVSGETETALNKAWHRLKHPGRFLVLMDVSGSMAEKVPGTGRTKLQFAQDAAITGMQLVPPDTEIGLWEFSTHLEGDVDFRELVDVGPVKDSMDGKTRLDALVKATQGLTPQHDTGMYDTALNAFRKMKETYTPDEPNVIVLITDGVHDDHHQITREELISVLKAEHDPNKPVRFLTLAFGRNADTESLKMIADATGGTAFNSPNPADIGKVFFQALMNG